MRLASTLPAALALALATPPALANGRFPAARTLFGGPGDSNGTLVLGTTFGIAVSTDAGHTWGYSCEASLGFMGVFDPPVVVAHDGSLVVGLPTGLSVSQAPYCTYTVPASAPATDVIDLAVDTMGDTVVAAIAPTGEPQGVAISSDRGATWHTGFTEANFYPTTVDIAPGHPMRMYASGYLPTGVSGLLRSDDGGATFAPTGADFSMGNGVYIAWVDATNPDVVYVRMSYPDMGGTDLLRSADAGAHFTRLVHTTHSMTGAAFAPDGHTLWVGSSDVNEGIQRSDDGGATWRTVQCGFNTLCLRYLGGTLYACADNALNGFALAGSTDGGEHFSPLLQFSRLGGPERCPAGTGTADQCTSMWPTVRSMASTDVPIDDGGVASIVSTCGGDAGAIDAGSAMDASSAQDAGVDARVSEVGFTDEAGHAGGGRCSCRAAGSGRGRARGVAVGVAFVAAALARRRRR